VILEPVVEMQFGENERRQGRYNARRQVKHGGREARCAVDGIERKENRVEQEADGLREQDRAPLSGAAPEGVGGNIGISNESRTCLNAFHDLDAK
jgi:hypothetical protein